MSKSAPRTATANTFACLRVCGDLMRVAYVRDTLDNRKKTAYMSAVLTDYKKGLTHIYVHILYIVAEALCLRSTFFHIMFAYEFGFYVVLSQSKCPRYCIKR